MDKILFWKKGLVLFITVLFIGVSFQSVVGVETETSVVNNPSEDDCGCETVNSVHLYKLDKLGVLLDRLEGFTKNLLMSSRSNPVVYEKCLEVFDSVNTITEKYEELSYYMDTLDWEYPIICAVYEMLYNFIVSAMGTCDAIIEYLDQFLFFGLFLSGFFAWVRVFLWIWEMNVEVTLYGFGCWEIP